MTGRDWIPVAFQDFGRWLCAGDSDGRVVAVAALLLALLSYTAVACEQSDRRIADIKCGCTLPAQRTP